MNVEEINERLSALVKGMLAKGLVKPNAEIWLRADAKPTVMLERAGKNIFEDRNWFDADTAEEAFDKATAWIAACPTPEQAKMNRFMAALSEAIELGKQVDVDADVVNPLLALMETISKNALTHQPEAVS